MAKKQESIYTQASREASKDLRKVMQSFGDVSFMREPESKKTQEREELFAQMAPDLQLMRQDGMPPGMLERLARMDMD